MEMTQVAFGTASEKKAATEFALVQSNGSTQENNGPHYHRRTTSDKREEKKKTEITHISLEC